MDRKQHLKQVNDLIKTFADPCDGIIYHYTSARNFQGIVESGEIWLTNTDFVNDTTECKALLKETDLFGDDELSFNRYVKEHWQNFRKGMYEDNGTYYIACFSKEANLLQQWLAYGNICIGFDAIRLKKDGFSLYECVYDKREIRKWILEKAKAKEWMWDEPDRTGFIEEGRSNARDIDRRNHAAISLILGAKIKLKHSCYESEKEVRLQTSSSYHWEYPKFPSLYDKDPPIHFRPHQGFKVPVPYVSFFIPTHNEGKCDANGNYGSKTEIQIKEGKRDKEKNQKRALLPIKKIWVGPTPHKEETRLACQILLEEKGYKDVQINVSAIPYRGSLGSAL
jgi:hypothetical protein